ncbi:MAG: ABC transporter permease [Candidatus Korobacteraceae bacterium]
MLKRLLSRLRSLVGRSRSDVDEELRFHIEKQIDANVASGMSKDEAHRQAMIAFGGVEGAREACHEQRPLSLLETSWYDIRYGLRGFRRSPMFTVTAILTLMIGIGTTTAVFSVVDRILFRPLPYADPSRLVSVGLIAPISPQEFVLGGWYYDWRDHQLPFQSLTSTAGTGPCDLTERNPERLNCAGVESTFLPTLGIGPMLGRNFTADEDHPNGPSVVLISYDLWRSHYGRDPAIVGRMISVDGQPARVIGVLPKEFEFPTLEHVDIIGPQQLDEAAQRKASPGAFMLAFARLKPGVTIEQASAALQPQFKQALNLAPPQFRKEIHLMVRSLRDRQVHDARLAAWVLLAAVIAVLMIACANVASLLLARAAARERELAVRSALGAGRTRLIRQTLTESLMLAVAGAIAGGLLAALLLRIFVAIAPEGLPFLERAHLDWRIIFFTFAASVICGFLFGMAPALHRPNAEALAGRATGGIQRHRLRQSLVIVQIAVSLILLTCAGLLLRSFWKLSNQPLGMHAGSVITASISLGAQQYPKPEQQLAFMQQLQARLRHLPGVNVLAVSDSLPPGGWHHDHILAAIRVAGRPLPAEGTGGTVAWRWVTADYFRALSIPIVEGRAFSKDDESSNDHFIIVSKLLAERLFPGANPIGQHLQPGLDGPWYTVIGVARNAKNGGLTGEDEPEYYRLRRNRAEDWSRDSAVIIQTSLPPSVMASWTRAEIAALDPTLPVNIQTMNQRVSELAGRPRFETALLGLFAFVGVLLAAIGIYGVIAFMVTQRTQEIGVRIALGATRGDVLQLMLSSGARLIAIGAAVGLLASQLIARTMASLLFGIGPADPVAFVAVIVLLIGVAFIATWIPARSAAKVDPLVALRYE